MNNPGIRKVYQKFIIDNKPVLVLEYVEGKTLKNEFVDHPKPLEETLSVAISVAQALGDIHSQNIIHKDINVSNIIVNSNDRKAVIIDFGIASRSDHRTSQPATSAKLEGTLYYISPEQTGRIDRATDYRTDIYSLGVTLYEMLTGKLPFPCTDTAELIHSHIAITPKPVCILNPAIPKIISDVVMKLMEKNPENRYQSPYGIMNRAKCRLC